MNLWNVEQQYNRCFFNFSLFLNVWLNSLLCSFTSISFLTRSIFSWFIAQVDLLGKPPSDNDINEFTVYPMWQYSWNEVFYIGKIYWIPYRNISGMSGDITCIFFWKRSKNVLTNQRHPGFWITLITNNTTSEPLEEHL